MAANNRPKIHFESVEELLGAPITGDGVSEVKIKDISAFENHPFKVLDDDKMNELVESIKMNGVITPVLVRPDDEGGYEMISGHRRLHAATLAGLSTIPAVIREMTDDEAVIAMVDGNVQREEILPSERAFSLKMKMDAMRRQGARLDLDETCGTEFHKSDDDTKKTREIVGKDAGMSGRQVTKYIRLTELIPELLDMVDEKKISIVMAVDLSYFDRDIQHWLYEYRKENGFLKNEQVAMLKNHPNVDNLTQYTLIQLLNGALPQPKETLSVSLSEKKLSKYFPPHFSGKQREQVIIGLLEKWSEQQGGK